MKLAISSPIFVLVAAVCGFTGWIGYEATKTPTLKKSSTSRGESDFDVPERPNTGRPAEAMVMALRVGMPQRIAERHLATFATSTTEPVSVSSGERQLQSEYRVNLGHPIPHLQTRHGDPFRPGPHRLKVEFDGQSPEHPISRIELIPVTD